MRRSAVLVPGTLCDARVFAQLTVLLDLDCSFAELGEASRFEESVDALLEAAPARFVGIGFSLGGFVILETLRRAPERLIGVVLLAGNAHPDAAGNAAIRRADVAAARRMGMSAFVADRFPGDVGARAGANRALRALLTDMAETIGHDGHARHAELNIARPDLRAVARASHVPLLVVAGDEDRLCACERYQEAAAGERGRLVLLPGVGHFVPIEAPETAARAINNWLVECPA